MIGTLFTEGTAAPAAGLVLTQVLRTSVTGGIFALAVWCLLRVVPRLPAGWRCALWWAVSLKLVLALVWVTPLELPVLPAGGTDAALATTPTDPATESGAVRGEALAQEALLPAPVPPAASPAGRLGRDLPWRPALALLWLLGVAAGAAGIGRELAAIRRLLRESRPATDPVLRATFEGLRERLGVRGRVALRLSETVSAPLTAGLVRPAVVLPASSREELSEEELELALAHELLHVRRHDLWTGWVPIVAGRLFFFHPLAALAAREYRLAREAACDVAVVRELGAAPRAYGRLLLRWSHSPAPETTLVAGAASPSFPDLKRRLTMLQYPFTLSRGLKVVAWSAAIFAVAALAPVRIVAAPPAPPAAPEAPAPPRAPEAPAPPAAPEIGRVALAPEAPEAPRAPRAPRPPEAPAPPAPPAHGYSYAWSGDGEAWALVEGGSHVWMMGEYRQMERARHYQSETGEPLLWIERDGREYVIRDRETVERAQEILEPSRELGSRQGTLGSRQGELGAEQGELGSRQGELGAEQGELGARQARLGAEQAALAAERAALAARRAADGSSAEDRARRAQLETEMKELSRRMRELGERQAELGRRQRELARPQAELGRRQAELGARQAALGEQQRAASARARVEIRELIDRALEQGLAEPVAPDR